MDKFQPHDIHSNVYRDLSVGEYYILLGVLAAKLIPESNLRDLILLSASGQAKTLHTEDGSKPVFLGRHIAWGHLFCFGYDRETNCLLFRPKPMEEEE